MPAAPDNHVHRSIEVELPPADVWELLVDDEERASWFGGATTLDPVPGGDGTFTDPDGTRRQATVGEVDEARRLTWTWWPEGDDGAASHVEIDLRPAPGGTTISVTEAPLAPVARSSVRAQAGSTRLLPLLGLEAACLFRSAGLVLA